MLITLPKHVSSILAVLNAHGYEAYAVGGCVRDSLLGRTPDDWDITTSALPEQVKELFERTVDTGIEHGTVTVLWEDGSYEVTTYRIDGIYRDGRHPDYVEFTRSLEEDLKRRDFTINAMAYHSKEGLIDIFGGMQDLRDRRIRAVGDPKERFKEDALRMLRAVRFSAQLGFLIEEETADAIRKLSVNLAQVSAERIRVELEKLLVSPFPERIRDAYELGLTRVFLPEFDDMMQTPQNTPHHMYSVGEHTIHAMMHIRADRELRLVMLLHDIAKPVCRTTDESGIDHFKGHPMAGADLAVEIMKRLKYDRRTMKRVKHFVYYHDHNPLMKPFNVRRMISWVGLDYYPELFEIKEADVTAQSMYLREEKLKQLAYYKKQYREVVDRNECVSIGDLAIGGKELQELGIPQGEEIGKTLQELLNYVLEDPDRNTKEKLLEYIRR